MQKKENYATISSKRRKAYENDEKSEYRGGATLLSRFDTGFRGVVCEKTERNYVRKNLFPKTAFTLAEVLITLGIIGVVAAMTIPTLIANYQKKVLKTQFMKKYAEISNVVLMAKNETSINLATYCTQFNGSAYYNTAECKDLFNKYFKVVGKCSYDSDIVTYNKKQNAYADTAITLPPGLLLSDGSCYAPGVNAGKIGFTFDINGAGKGPNAFGHDIFSFYLDNNGYAKPFKQSAAYTDEEIELDEENCDPSIPIYNNPCLSVAAQKGWPCNKNSNQRANGMGCSWYALHDVCPDDDTKGYWDCLP